MTRTTDIHRADDMDVILGEFMADGHDLFPDRSVDAVLAAIDSTAQRHSPLARLRSVGKPQSRRPILALLPVALIGLMLGGLLLTTGGPTERDDARPSPSAAPESQPAAVIPSAAADAMAIVTPATGVAAAGTIVFGVETGNGPALLSIRPDGTGLYEITDAATCCAVLSPGVSDNGNLEAGAVVMFARDDPDPSFRVQPRWYAGLPVFAPVAPSAPGFTEAWTGSVIADAGLPSDTRLLPGAWTGFDLAFSGVSTAEPRRDGIYLSLDNGGGMLIGDFVRMTGAPDGAHDIPIAFAPDGSGRLLFLRDAGIDNDLGVFGDLYVIERGPLASGGGGGVREYRPGAIRRLNPDGTLVRHSDPFGAGASWAPDGDRVAFTAFPRRGDTIDRTARVHVADMTTGAASPITDASTYTTSAQWSPDGVWIAYNVTGDGGVPNVWVIRPDGTGARQVASLSGGSWRATWSPDSRYLLTQGSDRDGNGLFIVSADGSGTTRLLSVDAPYDIGSSAWGAWPANP